MDDEKLCCCVYFGGEGFLLLVCMQEEAFLAFRGFLLPSPGIFRMDRMSKRIQMAVKLLTDKSRICKKIEPDEANIGTRNSGTIGTRTTAHHISTILMQVVLVHLQAMYVVLSIPRSCRTKH